METSDVSVSTAKYYVYILYSYQDRGWYIGFTTDLRRRLLQHAKRQVLSTQLRAPFKLIHYEYFVDRADAKAREVFLKSGYGRAQLKQILKQTIQGASLVGDRFAAFCTRKKNSRRFTYNAFSKGGVR